MRSTLELIAENLVGINILNFPRIKVGTGGSTDFTVRTAAGDVSEKRLEGIIVAARVARIYFRPGAGNQPPSCTSTDGFTGKGDPGGACKDCPYARFKSAVRPDGSAGSGQACKEVRQVLFLLPGEMLPHLINVPPTSIKSYTEFTLALISAGVPHWGATTILTLERAAATTGQAYAKMRFHLGTKLTPQARRILDPYRLRMRELLTPSTIDASTYEVVEDGEPWGEAPPAPEQDEDQQYTESGSPDDD
jgi:hypothetical protein